MTLREVLGRAGKEKKAVGHFNVSDLAALKGILMAAMGLNVPVMIGVSEGEREFVGVREIAALVRLYREEGLPVYLNADHTHSLEKVEEAARAGFDEILFDGSKLPFAENVRQTKQAVESAKSINPNVLVEGEVGYIGSSSEVVDTVPEGAAVTEATLTTPEEAEQFVRETKIDVLAPAVGTMHGLLKSMVTGEVHKKLNVGRIRAIKDRTNIFLTLHGGSGTGDADFVAGIEAGLTIIHENTDLRVAWRRGIEQGLREHPDEVAPYKLLPPAVQAVHGTVLKSLRLFNRL